MIAGWAAGVLEPAILDDTVVDSEARIDIGGIGFDELRAGVQEPDAVDMRGLRARIKDYFVVVGVADGEMGDRRVAAVGPDAKWDVPVVDVVHARAAEYHVGAAGVAAH